MVKVKIVENVEFPTFQNVEELKKVENPKIQEVRKDEFAKFARFAEFDKFEKGNGFEIGKLRFRELKIAIFPTLEEINRFGMVEFSKVNPFNISELKEFIGFKEFDEVEEFKEVKEFREFEEFKEVKAFKEISNVLRTGRITAFSYVFV